MKQSNKKNGFFNFYFVSRNLRAFEDAVIPGSKRGKVQDRHPSSASSSGEQPEEPPIKHQASITSWTGNVSCISSQHLLDDKIVDFFVENMISLRVRN